MTGIGLKMAGNRRRLGLAVLVLMFFFLYGSDVSAHTLPEVYFGTLVPQDNSPWSRADNLVLIFNGIVGFNDFLFLVVFCASFVGYFYLVKRVRIKGSVGMTKISFLFIFALIMFYFVGFLVRQSTASTLTTPTGGQIYAAGESISITWSLDGADHIELSYTTSGTACGSNDGGFDCGANAGYSCIGHPVGGTSTSWTPSSDTSTAIARIRVEGHTGGHDASGATSCSGDFTITQRPRFNSASTSVANNTFYAPNRNYGFQINWTDDFGVNTVFLENNFTTQNSTLINSSASCSGTAIDKICTVNFTDLKADGYQYRWIANDTNNTFNFTSTAVYSVAKTATLIRLFLNGTEGNKNYDKNNAGNFTSTINVTGKAIFMTSNMTGFGTPNTTTTIYNTTNLAQAGTFNMTAWFDGDDNYTSFSQTWFATVLQSDSEPPRWNNTQDNSSYKVYRGYTINISTVWTDNVTVDVSWLSTNETGSFVNYTGSPYQPRGLNSAGPSLVNWTWQNSSGKPRPIGWIIYANDTSNNTNGTNSPGNIIRNFTMFGWSNITWKSPDTGVEAVVGTVTILKAFVNDTNVTGSGPIENYNVSFYWENSTHGNLIGTNLTISNGEAMLHWNTSGLAVGTYFPKANITSNATLFYDASEFNRSNTTINLITSDTVAPTWSNNASSTPVNYTTTPPTFNVTWKDSVGMSKVLLESNFSGSSANYSMSLLAGTVNNGNWSFSQTIPAVPFYWKIYANDTSNNINMTNTWNFTISKGDSGLDLLLNGTSANLSIQNNTAVNITVTLNISGNASFYNNGVLANNTTAPIYNMSNFTGSHGTAFNITAAYTENQNYSYSSETWFVIIDMVAPGNVTNLNEVSVSSSSIDWTWTNPNDTDYRHAEVFIDGVFQNATVAGNPSNTSSYTKSGLSPSTSYKISLRTVDKAGNINTYLVNDTATTGTAASDDISASVSGPGGTYDHEGFCYTTNVSATCPSSGSGLLSDTSGCELYGWTSVWRHINYGGSYSCTIGNSNCIPNTATGNMRVAIEGHDASHKFIKFACSSAFSVTSNNFGHTFTAVWTDSSSGTGGTTGGGGGGTTADGTNATVINISTNVSSKKNVIVEAVILVRRLFENTNNSIIVGVGGLDGIVLNVNKFLANVNLVFQQLASKPIQIPAGPEDKVYGYFNITFENLDNKDIDNASVRFSVNKSWVMRNYLDENTVTFSKHYNITCSSGAVPNYLCPNATRATLVCPSGEPANGMCQNGMFANGMCSNGLPAYMVCDNGFPIQNGIPMGNGLPLQNGWVPLPTRKTGEDNSSYKYEADVKDFSVFTITARLKQLEAEAEGGGKTEAGEAGLLDSVIFKILVVVITGTVALFAASKTMNNAKLLRKKRLLDEQNRILRMLQVLEEEKKKNLVSDDAYREMKTSLQKKVVELELKFKEASK